MDELLAWRAWIVDGDALRSVTQRQVIWVPFEPMRAQCLAVHGMSYFFGNAAPRIHHDEPAPHAPCTCGIYACHEKQYAIDNWLWIGALPRVFGRVSLSGHILQFDHGFKAEVARIYEVIIPASVDEERPEIAMSLRKAYAVDVSVEPLLKTEKT